ncbi:hypothetical protein V8G54_022163, partial [Vigna mungo]
SFSLSHSRLCFLSLFLSKLSFQEHSLDVVLCSETTSFLRRARGRHQLGFLVSSTNADCRIHNRLSHQQLEQVVSSSLELAKRKREQQMQALTCRLSRSPRIRNPIPSL